MKRREREERRNLGSRMVDVVRAVLEDFREDPGRDVGDGDRRAVRELDVLQQILERHGHAGDGGVDRELASARVQENHRLWLILVCHILSHSLSENKIFYEEEN